MDILLDAMDELECDDNVWESIAEHLKTIGARFVFVITTRPDMRSRIKLKKISNVLVMHMDTQKDIEAFVTSQVQSDEILASFKELIITNITKTSRGMFRHVHLMMEKLKLPSSTPISKKLDTLPNCVEDGFP